MVRERAADQKLVVSSQSHRLEKNEGFVDHILHFIHVSEQARLLLLVFDEFAAQTHAVNGVR